MAIRPLPTMARSPPPPPARAAAAVVALVLFPSLGGATSAASTGFVATGFAPGCAPADHRTHGAFLPPGAAAAGTTAAAMGHDERFWGGAAGEGTAATSAGRGGALRASSSASGSSSALNYVNDDNEVQRRRQDSKPGGQRERHRVAPNGGRVTLVGAGPGSPDLLTVAAHRILTSTEETKPKLIIADRLVSDEILDLCRNAEIRVAKKYPGCAEKAQHEIYKWAEEGLADGRHVIRLKIGDPFVFGRGGEEVLRFREEMGMEPTVVPGVSAAFSAPLLGGIPVTHRGVSNQVVMCTGYGRNGTSPDLIRYHEEQTVVFLMAVGRLRQLCDNLADMAGYPRDTPVGIVERAGCPDQRTLVGTMDTIGDLAEEHEIRAPSTIVVGKVVGVLMEDLKCDAVGDAATPTPVMVQGLVQALNVTTLV